MIGGGQVKLLKLEEEENFNFRYRLVTCFDVASSPIILYDGFLTPSSERHSSHFV